MDILLLSLSLSIGSFLNVCIYRLPAGKSIWHGASHCPKCQQRILWRHKIPLFSFLFLKGRCFWCREKISPQYPLVEGLTAGAALILFLAFGLSTEFLVNLPLILLMIIIAGIDVKTCRIPNGLIMIGCILWLVTIVFDASNFKGGLVGALVGGAVVFTIWFFGNLAFQKEGMGAGDIKLAAMLGLFLGANGILNAAIIAIFSGGTFGIIGLLIGRLSRNSKLPFAPFLATGSFITLLCPMDDYWQAVLVTN